MRFWALVAVFILLAGCVGAPRVRTEVSIPSLEAGIVGVDEAYTAGWQRLRSGDTRQAMEMFRRSRADEDRLYVAFGFVYLVRGNLDLARKNFKDALTLNSDSASARLGMAEYHRNQGDMREAFRIYSRLRNEFPDNPWVRLRHEQIRSRETEKWLSVADRLEQSDNMGTDYRDALENALYYSPDMVALKQKLAEYLDTQTEGGDQAVEVYRDIIESMPGNLEAMQKLGRLYEERGQYDQALVIYRRLQEKDPGNLDILNRINSLKMRFNETAMPVRFKNIYFKTDLTREELAALLGHYFSDELVMNSAPKIITDIQHSFAREAIVKLCSLGIMEMRPDHSFGVGSREGLNVTRARFAVVMRNLMRHLESRGVTLDLPAGEDLRQASDVLPVHNQYEVIHFMINSRLMDLDENGRFRPAEDITPMQALHSILMIRRRMTTE